MDRYMVGLFCIGSGIQVENGKWVLKTSVGDRDIEDGAGAGGKMTVEFSLTKGLGWG